MLMLTKPDGRGCVRGDGRALPGSRSRPFKGHRAPVEAVDSLRGAMPPVWICLACFMRCQRGYSIDGKNDQYPSRVQV